jgi:hypothetical protein
MPSGAKTKGQMVDDEFSRQHISALGHTILALQGLIDHLLGYVEPDELEATRNSALATLDSYTAMQRRLKST